MLYTLSTILLLTASVFSAPIAEKRQAATVLRTITPNYLVPLSQAEPTRIFGSQYTGEVSWTPNTANEITTIVGFDIPTVDGANSCYLRFTLPTTATGFAWSVEGAGIMNYYSLDRVVNPATDSWNTRPGRVAQLGTVTVPPAGGEATFAGIALDCQALFNAQRVDWEFTAAQVGDVKNRVETFQTASGQGWYLEFAQV
ncbi:ubiquitin 3 binding protein But2 C-terminal domain-containing protein [Morchella snyderi]|nr:ubiquitin 3 binding protein But2 C-terminal domain-containing protein [Morchella snyderi]